MAWTIDLSGQVSLVTGGATGIGACVCRGLAEAGSRVAVNYYPSDRDRNAASRLISELEGLGAEALGLECDITIEQDVGRMVDAVISKWGRLDNLLNNAAIITGKYKMHELPYSEFRRIVSVSMDGTFLVTKACLPQMLAQQCGDIVMMGSGVSLNGGGDSVAYPAAKASLEGMMAQMVNEYSEQNIRVNIVRPMVIATPIMTQRYTEEGWNQYIEHMPMRRGGDPKEVADLVVFLLDRKRSGYIQGEAINIDGGRIYHVRFR
jgi:NAD(P)-dependent dehydrogenase (short-subunit alcohol dehydrogenase family)